MEELLEKLPDPKTIMSYGQAVRGVIDLANRAKDRGADDEYAKTLQDATISLQTLLIDVRAEAIASQDEQRRQAARIQELEQQIAQYENWEGEKKRYVLVSVGRSFAYLLRGDAAHDNEPPHYLCQPCYESGKKTILQSSGSSGVGCPVCNNHYQVDWNVAEEHGVFKVDDKATEIFTAF